MKLQSSGQERGARNEPTVKSVSLDQVELAIVERIHRERKDAHQQALDQLDTYDQRLNALDFEGRLSAVTDGAPMAVAEFEAEARQGRDELYQLRRGLIEHERERDNFKRYHTIDRAPRLHTVGAAILKIGLLVFLFAVETYVNGAFLAKGNELGLLGGAVEAFVFAVLNVLVSFFLALGGVRYLNHDRIFNKLYGFIAFIFWLAFVLLLNLALAHYREISGSLYEDAGARVIGRLKSDPVGLQDIKSWLFFAIGLVFSVIAFVDGLFFRDPFPGYGALELRVQAAHANYISRKDALIGELKDILTDAAERMEEARRDLGMRRSEHQSILQGRLRLAELFIKHQEHLERTANALLAVYRSANRETRTTSAPARFEETWKLTLTNLELQSAAHSNYENLGRKIEAAQELLSTEIKAIHQAFTKAVESYRQIDDLVPEERHGTE